MSKKIIQIMKHGENSEVYLNGTFEEISNALFLIQIDFLKGHPDKKQAVVALDMIMKTAIEVYENEYQDKG